jgi:hypothetical protein
MTPGSVEANGVCGALHGNHELLIDTVCGGAAFQSPRHEFEIGAANIISVESFRQDPVRVSVTKQAVCGQRTRRLDGISYLPGPVTKFGRSQRPRGLRCRP